MVDIKTENSILETAKELNAEKGIKEDKESIITPEEQAELDSEIELEQEFGDSDVRTFAESAASGATFGISDQILTKSGIVDQEDLRERRARNETAAISGEIAGVVGSALLSGGESLVAKAVGTGVKTASKAGRVAEMLTAKTLKKLMAESGKKSLAKQVLQKSITKGAGSAVEGTFYGAGKLLSEEALGNVEINAENLISHLGTSALIGGLAGSVFGSVQAMVPVTKGNKITSWVSKKVRGSVDPAKNAQQLAGVSPSKVYKMKKFSPAIYENTPVMLREVAKKEGVGSFSTNTKLFGSVKKFLDDTGTGISKSLDDISGVLKAKGDLPTRSKVAQRIVNKLDELEAQFKDADGRVLGTAREKVQKIRRIKATFDEDLLSTKRLTTKSINDLKAKYQKMAKWDRKGNLPLEENINRNISRALREEVLDLAEKAGGDAGANLKKQLLNYGTASEFLENFGQKIDKQSLANFVSVKDLFLGGVFGGPGMAVAAANKFAKSDLKRRLTILTGIEKANVTVNKKLKSSISNFLSGAKKASRPVTTKVLVNSALAYKQEEDRMPKKPKDKKEAFKNMQENIQEVSNDPESLDDYINLGNLDEAAPKTAQFSRITLAKAIHFLNEKMPKNENPQGMFLNREYEPSSVELYKFEKYVNAIENPMTIMDELENGMVSRESVEAIQAVYPSLYQKMQEMIITQIQKNPDKLSYQKRLNLGTLMDIPADASLNPEYILKMQSHFSEAQASQAGGTITKGKAAKLDMAESTATEVQKVSNKSD